MIELTKDKKSPTWILTKTDNEGFHRQVNLTSEELDSLVALWNDSKPRTAICRISSNKFFR